MALQSMLVGQISGRETHRAEIRAIVCSAEVGVDFSRIDQLTTWVENGFRAEEIINNKETSLAF